MQRAVDEVDELELLIQGQEQAEEQNLTASKLIRNQSGGTSCKQACTTAKMLRRKI